MHHGIYTKQSVITQQYQFLHQQVCWYWNANVSTLQVSTGILVNTTNALWCRYQALNNSTAISIPASTSLLVLNCAYSGNVTMNFDQAISNYCQSGISVFFTGTSPASWILNNTKGNILFYDSSGEQYSYTNTYTMVYYAGFYLKIKFQVKM